MKWLQFRRIRVVVKNKIQVALKKGELKKKKKRKIQKELN